MRQFIIIILMLITVSNMIPMNEIVESDNEKINNESKLLPYETGKQQQSRLAAEYNDDKKNYVLSSLPENTLHTIFYYYQKHGHTYYHSQEICELKHNIRTFVQLRSVCKKFNDVLTPQRIGNFCEHYSSIAKNTILKDLIEDMGYAYEIKRLPASILISAKADPNTEGYDSRHKHKLYLLQMAVEQNDIQFIPKLFEYNADPNIKTHWDDYTDRPLIFHIKTKEIAEIFIKNGANIHVIDEDRHNILWTIIYNKYRPELLELYLTHGAYVKKNYWGSSLLHCLVFEIRYGDKKSIANLLPKVKILLKAMPQLINIKSSLGTPLDQALSYVKDSSQESKEVLYAIIKLLREHGGVAKAELIQGTINNNEDCTCVIF